MEFPIRRSDLLNYRTNVLLKAETDVRINKIVTQITDGVLTTLKSTKDHKYVYNAINDLVFDMARQTTHTSPPDQQLVINKVLESLKNKFPDSTIVLDPLLKTITVDWSQMGPGDWKG
jgi:Zn-dependent M16 (insulinase) family peptidase